MMKFFGKWLATAVAVAAAVWLVPGIEYTFAPNAQAWVNFAAFTLVLCVVNIAVKPLAKLVSFPIAVITLGVFYLVINTLMLYLAVWLSQNMFGAALIMTNFTAAFFASIIISIVTAIMNAVLDD